MSKLQKRCFFASMGAHGLLLLVIAVGSAFVVPKSRPISKDRLRVVPSRLIDEALIGGGGNPNAAKTEEVQVQKGETLDVAPPPRPEQSKPERPEPVKPPPKPVKEPPKETAKTKEPAKEPAKEVEKAKEPPRKVSLSDLKAVKTPAPARSSESQAKKNAALAEQIARVRDGLKTGFNDGNVEDPFGPGGEAYADYSAFVKAVYDNAWILTENVADTGASTKVEVVIARDGDVVSARIIRPSGNPALDESIRSLLQRVKFVAPFPAGARDKTRSFKINFNLKNKIGAG